MRAVCAGVGLCFVLLCEVQGELIHRYALSNNVLDSAAVNKMNGTVSGNTTWLEAPTYVTSAPVGAVSGAPVNALAVGANNGTKKSFLSIPANAMTNSLGTLAFWFKPNGAVADNVDRILNATAATGLTLSQNAAGTVNASVYNISKTFSLTGALTDWHFYAVSWDKTAGTATVYIDNSSNTYSFAANAFAPGTAVFGTFSTADSNVNLANQWSGQYWDVQIYDKALTATAVGSLKTNPGSVIPESAGLRLGLMVIH
jgi:hypothetical protein